MIKYLLDGYRTYNPIQFDVILIFVEASHLTDPFAVVLMNFLHQFTLVNECLNRFAKLVDRIDRIGTENVGPRWFSIITSVSSFVPHKFLFQTNWFTTIHRNGFHQTRVAIDVDTNFLFIKNVTIEQSESLENYNTSLEMMRSSTRFDSYIPLVVTNFPSGDGWM